MASGKFFVFGHGRENDPETVPPMIFFRIGWMSSNRGQTENDKVRGGGAFVAAHGYGHEMFNFLPFQGRCYGYVKPSSGPKTKESIVDAGGIDLERLDPTASGAEELDGALIVWVASPKQGGTYIVGWYRNATVYRRYQPAPPTSNRNYKGEAFGYYASALVENATLLEPVKRIFKIPSHKKGGFGQSNVWYADDPDQHRKFRQNVERYIYHRELPPPTDQIESPRRQADPLLRAEIEKKAVKVTSNYFAKLGYSVNSLERDNVGWDLTAICGTRLLRLEVKGLSGSQALIELTPNEYKKMQQFRDSYCICIVTNTLSSPHLQVFSFAPESSDWRDEKKSVLSINEFTGARCSAGRKI
jgi:uncharacterized protein DUF3883